VTRYLPRAVLAAFAVLVAIAIVLTLVRHSTRVVGTNGVSPAEFVVTVPAGERACQAMAPAPRATRAIVMTVGVYGDQRARLRADAGTATNGRVVAARDGQLELPLAGAERAKRLCVTNVGSRRVELAGTATPPEHAAVVDERPAQGVFGVTFVRASAPTWAERLDEVLARVGYAKGMTGGSATGGFLIALLALTLAGALTIAWRTLRP